MMKSALLGFAFFAGAVPAMAMEPVEGEGQVPASSAAAEESPADAAALAGKPIVSGMEDDGGWHWPKIWFQVDIAPEIAQQDPFGGSDSQSNDSTEVRWTLGLKETIGDFINVDLRVGPAAVLDSDRDAKASSRFGGTLTLRTGTLLSNLPREGESRAAPRIVFSLNSYFNYGLALRYTDFFDERSGTDHTLDLGATILLKFPLRQDRSGELGVDIAPRRVESTVALGDYTSFRLAPRLRLPVFRDVAVIANGEIERRWYDDINPTIGRARRDWRVQGFAGLDFAGAINRCLGIELVSEASIGARLVDFDSNLLTANEPLTLKFAGAFKIAVPLTYRIATVNSPGGCSGSRQL